MLKKILNFPRKAIRKLKKISFALLFPKLARAEPHFQRAKKFLDKRQFVKAIDSLVVAVMIAPHYADAGRNLSETILLARNSDRAELIAKYRQQLLARFDRSSSFFSRTQYVQNRFFVLIALEEWLLAHRHYRQFWPLLKNTHDIAAKWAAINSNCLALSIETVGKTVFLDNIYELSRVDSTRQTFKLVLARAYWDLFAHEHAGKLPTKLKYPLLNHAAFVSFLDARKHGSFATKFGVNIAAYLQGLQTQSDVKYTASCAAPKILFVSNDQWHFLKPVVESFEAKGAKVRFLPFAQCEKAIDAQATRKEGSSVQEHLYGLGPIFVSPEEARRDLENCAPWASDLIEWADIIFVEWWKRPAVWMSRYLQPGKRLIIRCHSYEAFTPLPHFSNMMRVDGAIFIADHIKSVFETVFEDTVPSNFNAEVIQNIRDRPIEITLEKPRAAKFTLGMMQYADKNKDPIFALQILQELIAQDKRWKIKLVGKTWKESEIESDLQYREEFLLMVAQLGAHVEIEEFTDKPQDWHKTVGYIVSASQREGSHESVADGMATGAIPIIRKWPMVKNFGAPQSVYPGLQYFDTPTEAADYILRSVDNFESLSQASREWVTAQQDTEASKNQMWDFVVNDKRIDQANSDVSY